MCMQAIASLTTIAVIALTVAPSPQRRAAIPVKSPFLGVVAAVADGDTITVKTDNNVSHIVRIEGVDCPERGQAFGKVAADFTRRFALTRQASVRIVAVDSRDRLVSRVLIDGKDLSLELMKAGLAWHYTDFFTDSQLATAEREVRAARRGLWADADPTPPWVYRRLAGAPRARAAVPAAIQGPVRANLRSRVFHSANCRNYRCQNCTVEFRNVAEAAAAGYRPAGDCVGAKR